MGAKFDPTLHQKHSCGKMGGVESHVEVHALFKDSPDVKPDLALARSGEAADHLLHDLLHPTRMPRLKGSEHAESTDFEVQAGERGVLSATRWGPPDAPWILILPEHGGSRFHVQQPLLACCLAQQVSVVSVDAPRDAAASWGWHEGDDARCVLEAHTESGPASRCLALWGTGQQGSSAVLRCAAGIHQKPTAASREKMHAVLEGAHPTMRAFLEASHMRSLRIPPLLKSAIYQRIRKEMLRAARVDLDALDHARLRASIPENVVAQIHHTEEGQCPADIVHQIVLEDVMEHHLLRPLLCHSA